MQLLQRQIVGRHVPKEARLVVTVVIRIRVVEDAVACVVDMPLVVLDLLVFATSNSGVNLLYPPQY